MSTKKSLLSEIKAVQVKAQTCALVQATDSLSKADREGLEAALADAAIHGTTIHQVLKGRGIKVSLDVLRDHRRGTCCCAAEVLNGRAN